MASLLLPSSITDTGFIFKYVLFIDKIGGFTWTTSYDPQTNTLTIIQTTNNSILVEYTEVISVSVA